MYQPEKDMVERIFSATDQLMAKEGFANLSMHKIAKLADISSGTIYLYFKNKDELLNEFARTLFARFENALQHDEKQPFFARYRTMWWNIWELLQTNPTILSNIPQYLAIPHFKQICQEMQQKGYWTTFCQQGQQAGDICDLPSKVLFLLSIHTAIDLAFEQRNHAESFSVELLEQVIAHSWQAIAN